MIFWNNEQQIWVDENQNPLSEIFCDFEDIHIEGDKNHRYRIKHNPEISSFQYTVMESKTDTLGGKYPFIRRNGDTYYRQFPISGLITHFNEEDKSEEYMAENIKRYASNSEDENFEEDYFNRRIKERVANGNSNLKQKFDDYYYSQSNLNGYTDYLLEREYRQDVYDFLYKNRVRLFRSPTEGNILVKLMNITFSPEKQIDRRVSSMQCTAYEVDDFSIEKCIEYGIWDDNKVLLKDMNLSGHPFIFVGQLRHDDGPNLQQEGPFIRTNFYQEILDKAKSLEGFLNMEKLIWMKSEYYDTASLFGKDEKDSIGWVAMPSSPIISELRVNSQNDDNDDDIIVDVRIYDNEYNSELTTGFFDYDKTGIDKKVRSAVLSLIQKLAYLVVNYLWGSTYTYNGIDYSWDDINNWPASIRSVFANELNRSLINLDSELYTEDLNEKTILKNKIAWTIENIRNTFGALSDEGISSATGLYIGNQSVTKNDELLNKMQEKFSEENFNIISTETGLAFTQISVSLLIKPFNGYWQDQSTGMIYSIDEVPEGQVKYAELYIDFWISMALTMAFFGKWGFGTPNLQNLREKTIRDLIGDKGVLIDPGLTTNSLPALKTVDVMLAGHGMYINNELIIIPPQGNYELIDEDTEITQLSYQRLKDEPLKCLIDYAALCRRYSEGDLLNSYRTKALYYKLGQIRNVPLRLTQEIPNVIDMIKERYQKDISTTGQINLTQIRVKSIPYIFIEAMPYTIALIQDSSDEAANRPASLHTINDNGTLTLYDRDADIKQLYFQRRTDESSIISDRGENIYNNEVVEQDIIVNYICLIEEIRY